MNKPMKCIYCHEEITPLQTIVYVSEADHVHKVCYESYLLMVKFHE